MWEQKVRMKGKEKKQGQGNRIDKQQLNEKMLFYSPPLDYQTNRPLKLLWPLQKALFMETRAGQVSLLTNRPP